MACVRDFKASEQEGDNRDMEEDLKTELQVKHDGKNVSLLLRSTGDFYWGPFETRYVQNSILTLSI